MRIILPIFGIMLCLHQLYIQLEKKYSTKPTQEELRVSRYIFNLFKEYEDKAVPILVEVNSCRTNSLEELIYLEVNKGVSTTYERILRPGGIESHKKLLSLRKQLQFIIAENEQYELEKKQDEIAYESAPICSLGLTEEWSKNFREQYEPNSIFKDVVVNKEITVAVIDSGIDFKNVFLTTAIPLKYKPRDLNFTTGTYFDRMEHGTHVAGIILGVMPKAKILPLKALTIEDNIKALEFAIKEKVDIINISQEGLGSSEIERSLLVKAAKQGIVIVAAAGNFNYNLDKMEPYKKSYPASYDIPNLIVVGNSTANNTADEDSNYGKNTVDFFIRGTKVKSLVPGCKTKKMSGTSMSAPVVAGIVAHYKSQNPSLSVREIKKLLSKVAQKPKHHALSKYGYLTLSEALNQEVSTRNLAGK